MSCMGDKRISEVLYDLCCQIYGEENVSPDFVEKMEEQLAKWEEFVDVNKP